MLQLKSFIMRWLFLIIPSAILLLLYFLVEDHSLLSSITLFTDEVSPVENLTTATSIIAGFSGSILISILVSNAPALESLKSRVENYKEFINCFWFSVILSISSVLLGIVILFSKDFLCGIYAEIIISLWLWTFLGAIVRFCQGFNYAIDKLKPKHANGKSKTNPCIFKN
ncbi:MAG: hypothetical protein ACKO3R_07810, partial [bacterium]